MTDPKSSLQSAGQTFSMARQCKGVSEKELQSHVCNTGNTTAWIRDSTNSALVNYSGLSKHMLLLRYILKFDPYNPQVPRISVHNLKRNRILFKVT